MPSIFEDFLPATGTSSCGDIENDGSVWRYRIGGQSIEWTSPPEVLHGFISELFSTAPEDVPSWLHEAAWRLREDSWQHQLRHSQCMSLQGGAVSSLALPSPMRPEDIDVAGSDQLHSKYASLTTINGDSNRSMTRETTSVTDPCKTSRKTGSALSSDSILLSNFFNKFTMPTPYGSYWWSLSGLSTSQQYRAWFAPSSRTCFLWASIYATCLLFELWSIPFELFFWTNGLPPWTSTTDIVCFTAFIVDILVNLRTGSIQQGVLHMKGPQVFMPYIKSWMVIDILATVPYMVCIVASIAGTDAEAARYFVLVRALRLNRVEEWTKLMPLFLQRTRSWLPLAKLLFVAVLLGHAGAVLLAVMQPEQWVEDHPDGASGCYWQSLWWSFLSLTFGSTPPGPHRGYQILWDLLLSVARLVLVLLLLDWSKACSLIQFSTTIQNFQAGKGISVDELQAYLHSRAVQPALQIRVLQAIRQTELVQKDQSRIKWLNEQNIDPDLRYELNRRLWEKKIRTLGIMVPLVQWHSSFAAELATFVNETILAPGAILFETGDPTLTAYFILKGALAVLNDKESRNCMTDYTESMWVGEQALVNPELMHAETLLSRWRTELMAIHACDFRALLAQHGLLENYEAFLQQTLWMGFCGRCGVFGDHFSQDCPLVEGRKRNFFRMNSHNKKKTGRQMGKASKEDLTNLLGHHCLLQLAPHLRRYSIRNVNDLNKVAFDDFLDDEDNRVSREDKEKLRRVVDKLKRRAVEGTTALMHIPSAEEHYIFISHYKSEAGTEATLMQRDLEGLIGGRTCGNLTCPVFVDSENLTSLADIHASILRSQNVVVLLTPGVLTRPWVLVELALAYRHEINVITVEIQRPNMKFHYPDETYFQGVRTGESLNAECREVLQTEEITLDELECILRQLFKLIAVPFSPHKSASIRHAELQDIIKRCSKNILNEDAHGFQRAFSAIPTKSLPKSQPVAREVAGDVSMFVNSSRELSPNRKSPDRSTNGSSAASGQISSNEVDLHLSLPASEAMDRLDRMRAMPSSVHIFKMCDKVAITKESRTHGKTAIVTDPDWHGLIKVDMDEEDIKGKVKTFRQNELKLLDCDPRKLRIGDKVRVTKESRTKGKLAIVIDENWHGLVKVCMDQADEKGITKSFKATDLDLVHAALRESVSERQSDAFHVSGVTTDEHIHQPRLSCDVALSSTSTALAEQSIRLNSRPSCS